RPASARPLWRQPAKGHSGEMACAPRAGATARRADAGDRRWRQGADPRSDPRLRRARWRRLDRIERPRRIGAAVRRRARGAPRRDHSAARPGAGARRGDTPHGDRRVKQTSTLAAWRGRLAGQIPLISLIALCILTALLTPRFLSPLNLTNILVQSSIMAVNPLGVAFLTLRRGLRSRLR